MKDRKRIIGIGLAALMLCSLCAVCASTGAMAVMNTNPAKASKIDAAPAVVSTGDNQLTVFAKGEDKLYKNSWDGSRWSGWGAGIANPAGRTVNSNPAAVYDGTKVWFGAIFDNGQLFVWDGTKWSVAAPAIGVAPDSSPALAFQGTALHVFVVDNGNKLQEIKYTGGAWDAAWTSHGSPTTGNLEGSPGATAWASVIAGSSTDRIDVFVPDSNNGLQQWSTAITTNGGWNNKYSGISPEAATAPGAGFGTYKFAPAVAAGPTDNRLDIFYTDTDGHCQQLYWNGKWITATCPWPIPPKRIGDMTSSPSAIWWKSDNANRVDVFCRGTGEAYLWQEWWTGSLGWQNNWKGGPGIFPALPA